MSSKAITAFDHNFDDMPTSDRGIRRIGITIIVIEHLMRVVTALAERTVVLHHGAVASEGPTDEVMRDPKVIEAYLGNKFAQRFAETSGVPVARPA